MAEVTGSAGGWRAVRPDFPMIGAGFPHIGMRREPTAGGLPVYGVAVARLAWWWAGCGCWRRAGLGAAEPCWVCCGAGGAPAAARVPMGRGTGAYGERSQRISLKMLPVGRGAGAGPPGTARRMTQQSPQHQGAPGYRVSPPRPRRGGGPIGGGGAAGLSCHPGRPGRSRRAVTPRGATGQRHQAAARAAAGPVGWRSAEALRRVIAPGGGYPARSPSGTAGARGGALLPR